MKWLLIVCDSAMCLHCDEIFLFTDTLLSLNST